MDELNNFIYISLQKYFNTVFNLGITSQKDIDNLIILKYIRSLIQQNLQYITQEDLFYIIEAIGCLQNSSCILSHNSDYTKLRINTIDEKLINMEVSPSCGCTNTELFI